MKHLLWMKPFNGLHHRSV